jgi:hypothetical protein
MLIAVSVVHIRLQNRELRSKSPGSVRTLA